MRAIQARAVAAGSRGFTCSVMGEVSRRRRSRPLLDRGIVAGGPTRLRLGALRIGAILTAQPLAGRVEAQGIMIEVVVRRLCHRGERRARDRASKRLGRRFGPYPCELGLDRRDGRGSDGTRPRATRPSSELIAHMKRSSAAARTRDLVRIDITNIEPRCGLIGCDEAAVNRGRREHLRRYPGKKCTNSIELVRPRGLEPRENEILQYFTMGYGPHPSPLCESFV